jgi:hypothetical protein
MVRVLAYPGVTRLGSKALERFKVGAVNRGGGASQGWTGGGEQALKPHERVREGGGCATAMDALTTPPWLRVSCIGARPCCLQVLRFMAWMDINNENHLPWDQRTLPSHASQAHGKGGGSLWQTLTGETNGHIPPNSLNMSMHISLFRNNAQRRWCQPLAKHHPN